MKKILIVADGITMAHPTRMEELVNQIDRKLFEIHFATSKNYFPILSLDAKDVPTHTINSLPTKTFMERIYHGQFPWSRAELDAQFKEDLELLKEVNPDIVIGDTRLTLGAACKREGIPYYNLVNFHWTPQYKRPLVVPYIKAIDMLGRKTVTLLAGSFTSLFELKQKLFINSWLKSVGASPVKSVYDFYCQGDFLLFPDLASNFKDIAVPANGSFIGPLLWKNTKTQMPSEWGKLDPKKKYALVSMGSSGETKHIPKVVKALNFLGYVVIYIGPKSVFDKIENYNMLTADFVPLDQVLDHCTLAIGNGGTNTTYHYLSKGVPAYYIPTNMDQYLSVTHLKELGLTDFQDIDDFTEKVFVERITTLLNSSQVRSHCLSVKNAILEDLKQGHINRILTALTIKTST